MLNTIIVFDFETTGRDPNTCEPVQIAACAINSKTLEIKRNSSFEYKMQPVKLIESEFTTIEDDAVNFHCKHKNCTREELFEGWKAAPHPKQVFKQFVDYVHQHNWKKTKWTAPAVAGHNILNYDLIILDRLIQEYKMDKDYLFHPRDKLDTMYLCMHWFESLSEPRSYGMEVLRPFFGFSSEGAHDAAKDVEDCAQILIKFLNLHRKFAPKIEFKNAFANK